MDERPLFVDEGLMSSLSAQQPEVLVDDMLRYLIRRFKAEGGAVFALQDTSLHVYVARTLAERRIRDAAGMWPLAKGALVQRESVRMDTELLAPLHTDDQLLGFLFLDFPEGGCHEDINSGALSVLCKGLTRGLGAARCNKETAIAMTPRDLKLLATLSALEVSGGSKAKAAELLGVSRRVVYYRLDESDGPRRPRRA